MSPLPHPDLFGPPPLPVPGLAFRADFIEPAEEAALIARIGEIELPHFAFQQWMAKRRARSFGWLYDFQGSRLERTEAIPTFLLPLAARAAAFAGLPADTIVQSSLIEYEPGAGIGWHKDRREFESVIGISLGAPAVMRLRRREETGFSRASLALPPRSIYLLSGEVRHDWEHGIAPGERTRWSVTLRTMSETGRKRSSDA